MDGNLCEVVPAESGGKENKLGGLHGKMKPKNGFVRLAEKSFSGEKVKRGFGFSRLAKVEMVGRRRPQGSR